MTKDSTSPWCASKDHSSRPIPLIHKRSLGNRARFLALRFSPSTPYPLPMRKLPRLLLACLVLTSASAKDTPDKEVVYKTVGDKKLSLFMRTPRARSTWAELVPPLGCSTCPSTMIVIFLASGGVLMLMYLIYNCLKRGKLCPRGLTDVLNHQSDIRYRGRLRYRRGDEEEPRLTPLMMYPGGAYPCPAVANVGQMAAGIKIPAGCPSAPDQPKMRQFSHVRPGGSEGGFI